MGEIKKARYVYYHCAGPNRTCPEPYVRQEVLEERLVAVLGQLTFDEGIRLLELARCARELFEMQDASEKRRLLDFVLSNSVWKDGDFAVTLRQPPDLLAVTTAAPTTALTVPGIRSL